MVKKHNKANTEDKLQIHFDSMKTKFYYIFFQQNRLHIEFSQSIYINSVKKGFLNQCRRLKQITLRHTY